MSRGPVQIREACPDDAEVLLRIWADLVRRTAADRHGADAGAPGQSARLVTEAATAVARIAADPDQQLLLGVLEGAPAGAVHLVRAPLSPLSCEQAIHITALQVLDECRRHGVGHALLEATVRWAEEKDCQHLTAVAATSSRDANRFLARLGLGQVATVRRATVSALRAKLPVEPPAAARVGASSRSHRSVGQVLAQRRSLRRAQEKMLG